jgi:hypothetical protein
MRIAELAWGVALIGLAVYESWALLTSHTTLSRAIWMLEKSQYGPLLPFLAGLLCGHLFWSGQ